MRVLCFGQQAVMGGLLDAMSFSLLDTRHWRGCHLGERQLLSFEEVGCKAEKRSWVEIVVNSSILLRVFPKLGDFISTSEVVPT